MKDNHDNVTSLINKSDRQEMEKKALKELIRKITIDRGISSSQLARECGVAESTITGFMNDVSNRAKHGLSAKTQNAIANKFPEFKAPMAPRKESSIPVIGQWIANYNVIPLMPNMASSIVFSHFENAENQRAVLETQKMMITHVRANDDFQEPVDKEQDLFRIDQKYYIFENKFVDPLTDQYCVGKTCYGQSESGIFYLGILKVNKNKATFLKFNGENLKDAGEIIGVSKVQWVAFL